MSGITGTIIKTIIQTFSTISSIESEIEKSVHSNSMVSSIDLDILNL